MAVKSSIKYILVNLTVALLIDLTLANQTLITNLIYESFY